MNRNEAESYKRYRAMSRRFELIGAAIFAAGVLCYAAFGNYVKWPGLALGFIGFCAAALGAAALRPHNVIKSFALQCMQNPTRDVAEGLLNALEAQRKVRLTAASLQMIEKAVLVYACSANADKALAERMAQALGDRVVKKKFF